MPTSIESYKKMYCERLMRLTIDAESQNDETYRRNHLKCIAELMESYKKSSDKSFLGAPMKHHGKEAVAILEVINSTLNQDKQTVCDQSYKEVLEAIAGVINKVSDEADFNKTGDFANIHEALKECVSEYPTKTEKPIQKRFFDLSPQ